MVHVVCGVVKCLCFHKNHVIQKWNCNWWPKKIHIQWINRYRVFLMQYITRPLYKSIWWQKALQWQKKTNKPWKPQHLLNRGYLSEWKCCPSPPKQTPYHTCANTTKKGRHLNITITKVFSVNEPEKSIQLNSFYNKLAIWSYLLIIT